MNQETMYTILSISGLLTGVAVGVTFGMFQHRALLRDQKQQETKGVQKRRLVVPSSFRRIFYLVITLLVIQIVCPILFKESAIQWIITAGIIVGYGWTLLKRIRTYKKDYTHIALV